MSTHRQALLHHDRRNKRLPIVIRRPLGVFTEGRIHFPKKRTSITMLVFLPLLCTIIYVSILNSQRPIDTMILLESQMLLRTTTAQLPTISSGLPEMTPPPLRRFRFRYNYTNLQRYSSLANDIAWMQSKHDCTAQSTTGFFWYRNRYGLGSDLHVYSVAICNALQMNYHSNPTESVHVQSLLPWIWYDERYCGNRQDQRSAMTCYFPESEPQCPITDFPQQQKHHPSINLTRTLGKIKASCSDVIQTNGGISFIRTATTEFLFTRISTLVQEEGERQLNYVYQNRTASIPHNLISVHIRWGDKVDEMELIPITKYIDAVNDILEQRQRKGVARNEGVHIYLATEDPEALRQFQESAPIDWNIYIDQYYTELLPHRKESTVYNGIPQMARELSGRPGLIALGSLLVAMEANDYVLTTSSNWSRLMNEIRISIINPRCNNCTTMIDLNPGEW